MALKNVITPDEKNIPRELREAKIWVVYDEDKHPFKPELKNGRLSGAKANDPNTWGSFEDAVKLVGGVYKRYAREKGEVDVHILGVGINLNPPYSVIDLDHVIDDKGVLSEEAKEIIESVNSYTEYSPSGTGVHIIVKAELLERFKTGKNNKGRLKNNPSLEGIEIYQEKRYITYTGKIYDGMGEIKERTEALRSLQNKYIRESTNDTQEGTKTPTQGYTDPETIDVVLYTEGDTEAKEKGEQLVEDILNPKELENMSVEDFATYLPLIKLRDDFKKLYIDGDTSWYEAMYQGKGLSEADIAFCGKLANKTLDTRVIDYIWQKSAIYRDKSNERPENYRKPTIRTAIKNRQNYVLEAFERGKRGAVKKTIENVKIVLDSMGKVLYYNVLDDSVEDKKKRIRFLDDLITEVQSQCSRIGLSMNQNELGSYITKIAREKMYNPFRDYLIECEREHKEYVSGKYIGALFDTLIIDYEGIEIEERDKVKNLYRKLFEKWLVSVVALNYEDDLNQLSGADVEGCLVLLGGQGIGKTTLFRNLVPEGFFKEGATLENTKDNILEVFKYPIVELGELEYTTRKKENGFLKNTLTRRDVEVRPPYARKAISKPRRTVFCGTVNESDFLKDATGNRRYWVIPIQDIDRSVKVDIKALWGEVVQVYKDYKVLGINWTLGDEKKLLNELNTKYIGLSPIGTVLRTLFDFDSPKDTWGYYYPLNEIVNAVLAKYKGSNVTDKKVTEQLKILGAEQDRKRVNGEPRRFWVLPKRLNTSDYFPECYVKGNDGNLVECKNI